jgi:hypothetical protein
MNLPTGQLVRSRVVDDPAVALAAALDRELTGYCVLAPQDALLLDADGKGVLTFESGVPAVAYHVGTDRGGPAALADLAVPGPYSADLYELDAGALDAVHDTPELSVPPGMAAERLAGDLDLAERTRAAAPADRRAGAAAKGDQPRSAVEAFLADEEKVEAIREQAREEAQRRAEEWGLDDELVDDESV